MEFETTLRKTILDSVKYFETLQPSDFSKSEKGKWSVAEQIVHLNKSVAPINLALKLPKFSFMLFGKSNQSRTYEEIIDQYKRALEQGAKASLPYVPSKASHSKTKAMLIDSFTSHYETLLKNLNNWSSKDLKTYRLPHPIIGKITIMEMLYFTDYHINHHIVSIKATL